MRSRFAAHLLAALLPLAMGVGAAAGPLLPDQSPDRHLGVASCSSSVCHGAVHQPERPGPLMNEFVTWSHQDTHAKAYEVLSSAAARGIALKLGIGPAEKSKLCLDCHSDNVPAAQRAKTFAINDGVGCEACHGGAERWISTHTAARANYRTDVKSGMYPTADAHERAALCLSCHYGTQNKFATHRIMGAGHPRLSFELDTFLALEPVHYRRDEDYRKRKPSYSKAEQWCRGQLLDAQNQLQTLEGPIGRNHRTFPELALFNCSSCHDSSMHRLDWRPRRLAGTGPGEVLLNDATLRMVWVIAKTLSTADGDRVQSRLQALQKDAVTDWPHLATSSAQLGETVSDLLARIENGAAGPSARALLDTLVNAGLDGEYRDYPGAEQAVMAIDLLLLDAQLAETARAESAALYRDLKSDDSYRSVGFIADLQALRDRLK